MIKRWITAEKCKLHIVPPSQTPPIQFIFPYINDIWDWILFKSKNMHFFPPIDPLPHNSNFQPITGRQILDSSKLKEFADHNFKFDKKGRKLSKQAENTGKRRNCSLRAISRFPTVFSKGLFPRGSQRCHCEGMSEWTWEKGILKTWWKKKKMLETSIFSFSPQCLLHNPKQIQIFQIHLFCRLQ